jgi:hypothetical protein
VAQKYVQAISFQNKFRFFLIFGAGDYDLQDTRARTFVRFLCLQENHLFRHQRHESKGIQPNPSKAREPVNLTKFLLFC